MTERNRWLNESFTDQEFAQLKKVKGKITWHDFILSLIFSHLSYWKEKQDDNPTCSICGADIKENELMLLTEHNYGYALSRPSGSFDYWCHNCITKAPKKAVDYFLRWEEVKKLGVMTPQTAPKCAP